jgi:hypothetical protein
MIKVETEASSQLTPESLEYFGGKYTLWERLKMGGSGSPKINYVSGIEEFDRLKRDIAGDAPFVSFELFKNGLILRLNNNQRFGCVGMRLNELKSLNLVAYRIEIKQRRAGKEKTKIVHRGELEIVEINERLKFSVIVSEFDGLRQFFQKEELADKFHFSVSTNPPEKDHGHLLDIIGRF